MTEEQLREPPLLGEEDMRVAWLNACHNNENLSVLNYPKVQIQAQREADKKWIKEHCYLRAKERQLPSYYYDRTGHKRTASEIVEDMLKEVDGVSFKACKEFKD